MRFTENDVMSLREEVKKRLSDRRYAHTLGVLNMAEWLAEKCDPEHLPEIRVAALLHDITKELTVTEQYDLLKEYGIFIPEGEGPGEAILHSVTAPLMICRDFPKFASNRIMSAVRVHTTGSPDMSVTDKIIFLADFIEENRTYPECISLRSFVLSSMQDGAFELNLKTLNEASLRMIESTLLHLEEKGREVDPITYETRDELKRQLQI